MGSFRFIRAQQHPTPPATLRAAGDPPHKGEGKSAVQFAISNDLARCRHTFRSTISFLISAIALAGLRPFGQAFAQFMMVWQR